MKAKIIQDSINSWGDNRLTTFVLEFPRFINAEILRHRMLSFNSASSRAIPVKKMIESVRSNPAEPVFWGKNQSGMQAYEELDEPSKTLAKEIWKKSSEDAIKYVEELTEKINLHKQIANRIIEPWQNITLIVSGTEWENFFKLRASEFAQPEFRVLAEMMLEEYNKSIPEIKRPVFASKEFSLYEIIGNSDYILENVKDWHMPFGERMPEGLSNYEKLKVSVARCARVSYLTQDGEINPQKDFELFQRLTGSGHWSPCEHVAFPVPVNRFFGNFKGWFQMRKLFSNENQSDIRVIKRRIVDGKVV